MQPRLLIPSMAIAAWAALSQSHPAAFEAASVKASGLQALRGADFRLSPGRLVAEELTLEQLVMQAYGVNRLQLSGGPAWFKTAPFDIEATAAGNPARDQMMRMLQALLVDRFQLKVRKESREGKAYALVVAKGGPKLKTAAEGEGEPSILISRLDPPERPTLTFVWRGRKASMALLAQRLMGQLQTPAVLDKTAINGMFDFRLEFAADDPQAAGPSLFTALQDELGLKLEPTRGSVETLVVDHADKPSGN